MCLFKKELPPAVPMSDGSDITLTANTITLQAGDIRVIKIATSSMRPMMGIGTFAFIDLTIDYNNLRVGHDLMFDDSEVFTRPYVKGTLVLHRIIEIDNSGEWRCRTQGLNNSKPDKGWREATDIRGRFVGLWNG